MERRGSVSGWLVLLAALLAASLVPPFAAAEVKTSPTEWSLHLPLPSGVIGAESLAFNACGQGPYTGVSDDRLLRWGGGAVGWTTFAHHANYRKFPMCTVPVGAPQTRRAVAGGLAFHRKSGDLYIGDAYKVLMRVSPDGGEVEVLATSAGGVPFNFVNDIDIDQATCDVYFTDSSVTFNTEIMMNADGEAAKVRRGDEAGDIAQGRLAVPNGVAVSHDRTYVVVAHTVPCQAHRYYQSFGFGPKKTENDRNSSILFGPGFSVIRSNNFGPF
ncbi:hypothetical protein ZWY2020_029969 [Hordeum vulgare]|nr:hypothetical protein ZWY2020_029969 [Hordeum vulgare]